MSQEMICIVCPQGCMLKIDKDENGELLVSNNKCARGPVYAQKELTNPTRTLTATVHVENGALRCLPVKSNEEIPKGRDFEAIEEIKDVVVKAPIKMGDVIVENILGLGIDLIATRSLKAK